MTAQKYATEEARIGALKGSLLKTSIPTEVLGITGTQHKIGKNQSDTVIYRRWLPFGGATTNATTINEWVVDPNDHLTAEGVTPPSDTINAQDITVKIRQYSCLYQYSDKVADLYEDNIPDAMKDQTGKRMGQVREQIKYGAMKGGTNKFYAGGTTRLTVDEAISLGGLRSITRSIMGNEGELITKILSASQNYNTAPVEAAYLVFCHSDCENDIRELPGFKECSEYGSRKVMHTMELGSTDRYRFIISPQLKPITDSGALTGNTGLVSSGTRVDIYPIIVVAEDACGDVALRGKDSFEPTHILASKKDSFDPLGQKGYIGATFWSAAFVQNDGWLAVYECGVSDL